MTAVDERAETATGAGVPRCMAMVDVPGLVGDGVLPASLIAFGLVRCGLPAAGWWQGRCPCGHVRDGWRCEHHEENVGEGGCLACLELPGNPHLCPLPLTRITGGPS
jgi:hypothetical protein